VIGDSLTRHQCLSLAHFIHHGEHPKNVGMPRDGETCQHFDEFGNAACSMTPHICLEHDFRAVEPLHDGWLLHHETVGGGKAEATSVFGGHLECQCRRGVGPATGPMVANVVCDGPPQQQQQQVKLTHFMEAGWPQPDPTVGWDFTDCSKTGTCTCTRKDGEALFGNHDCTWSQVVTDLLNPVNGSLPTKLFPVADFVLHNRGMWGKLPKD